LISFQEAIKTTDYDQVADLLGPDYHVVYQRVPEPDGQSAALASRWPIQSVREADLQVTPRCAGFAATTLVAEIVALSPFGPLLLVNHLPNWQLNFELERELQAAKGARFVEDAVAERELHVILAADLTDAPDSASVRLWTGRQSVDGVSVCYRDAWDSANPGDPGETFTPRNPIVADWDWPLRRLDYILVRCGSHGGPTLAIRSCWKLFDGPIDGVWASDHFGVVAGLEMPSRPTPPSPNRSAESG
jgi:endonuclease/exonuclease/phosphatase family metal-dependent hydrolase